jgi:hypothetical protein
LSHSSYSPDIDLRDFLLFGHIKMKLEGMSFASPSALVCEVHKIIDEIWITKWAKGFGDWEVRLRRCIDSGGNVFKMHHLSYDVIHIKKFW